MEKVLIKYSDFFDDDGGFNKIRDDFKRLGDEMVKEANDIKKKVKESLTLDDVDGIAEVEKQTEGLTKAWEKYGTAKENIEKIEKEYQKQIKKSGASQQDQIDILVKLDKELADHRSKLKEIQTLAKLGIKTDRDLNKERVEAQLAIKKVTKEIRDQQKEVLESQKLSKKEEKLLKAKITLEKEQVKTLDDVRERMSALRTVVQSLDLENEADKIKAYNDEINELTEVLSGNSDKFIQSKINVGNYEESIVNALGSTGLFESQLSGLNQVLEGLVAWLFKTDDAMDAMDASAQQNVGAIQKLTVAFRRLNTVLKASIIGAILIAVTALASAFGNTRAGAVRTEKALMSFQSTLANLGQMAQTIFKGIGQSFALIGILMEQISKFSLKDILSGKAVIATNVQIQKQLENIKKTFSDIGKIGKSGIDAIVKGLEYIDRAYKLEDRIRRTTQEIAKLNGEMQIAQSQADDATKSLSSQLLANQKALELSERLSEKQLQVQKDQLEVINNKVKQNILANGVEADNVDLSKTGVEFANEVLALAERRGVSLEIANDLIEQQQSAVVELINVENEHAMVVEDNGKKRREIQRDIFEQNLDLLIDLIDTEKNLSEQYVNDVTKNFQNRLNEFNRFIVKFRETSQQQLDEFTKEASNLGLDLDFSIEYDENGDFKVFAGDTELATDNIVELNSQLQSLGMNEIDINRFREFMVETRNGVRDFRLLAKEIQLVGINVKQLRSNLAVSESELKALDELQNKINALNEQSAGNISDGERKKLITQIEALEKERTAIQNRFEKDRIANRKEAIDAELETVEQGSERYYELLQERIDLEKQLRDQAIDDTLDKTKEANKKALEDYDKYGREVRQILTAVADKAVEIAQKRVDASEEAVEKQNDLVDKQQERAQAGLENTLAFEQKMLAKREAEKIKAEKKAERIEKIRALYSSYANYASQGDDNPIVKALRDFAILEAITASFGDGGIVEDKIADKNHGIIRGRSHRGRQGGIPILVEGQEGIFSRREMENLGKENFYKMKDLAGLGKVDSNFFTDQRKEFVRTIPIGGTDPRVISTLNEVKRAIESKPVPSYQFEQLADGAINIIEMIQVKNGKKRNIFKTKKPRI